MILVVEDDAPLRRLLVEVLEDEGHVVEGVPGVDEGWQHIQEKNVDLVISDLRLPDGTGLDLLARLQAWDATQPPALILITAFGTVAQAVEALKRGAQDFLTKPLDLDHLTVRVSRALEVRRMQRDVATFREVLGGEDFRGMVGRSPVMEDLFRQIQRLALGVGPVLVEGESGVGKELVARAIHAESPRASGPFLAVNCGGVPGELLESEFFGHTKGAFTGAHAKRKGLFQKAHGGTLLLDEVGEMPNGLQVKLLRVLQEGRVRPVGADGSREVDVRVVAATNRDLRQGVEEGSFREDLYFRLETFRLGVPPLREREGDLPLLVARFVAIHSARLGKDPPRVTPEVLERLQAHPFPGNVRELRNLLERAVTFCDGSRLELRHLPERFRDAKSRLESEAGTSTPTDAAGTPPEAGDRIDELPPFLAPQGLLPTLKELEDRYIRWVLAEVGGNKRRAAALLGIGRNTLYRRLED